MAASKAYWIYWCTCFATFITWVLSVAAAADETWFGDETNGFYYGLGDTDFYCPFWNAKCRRYNAATAFQYMATGTVSLALLVVAIAAFAPAHTTGRLGLAAGILLAAFSWFQMLAFSLIASFIAQPDTGEWNIEAGPDLGVAVAAWLLGLIGAIVILVLRSSATTGLEGPFRKCMSEGGGVAGGGSAGPNVGTV